VDLAQATNILDSKWDEPNTMPSLEALLEPRSEQLRVLPKSLIADLAQLGGVPEKIEGIALIDRNTLAIANDNDFDSEESKYDEDGNNLGKGKKSQILIVSLGSPLPR
jgi:hypothetical protein